MFQQRRLTIEDEIKSIRYLTDNYLPPEEASIEGGQDKLYYVPSNQREFARRWKGLNKKAQLVDSIIMNYPIPSIIVNMDERRRFGIHEGRHRVEIAWMYRNNKFRWNDKFFSELDDLEKHYFLERKFQMVVAHQATPDELAEIFERLNAGVPLSDSDKLWGRKERPLVKLVRTIYQTNQILAHAWGDCNMANRKQLANDTGVVAGLVMWDPNYFTTSYDRLYNVLDLPDIPTDKTQRRLDDGMIAMVTLYTRVSQRLPQLKKATKGSMRSLGFINAYFLSEWMQSIDDEVEDLEPLFEKWVRMVSLVMNKATKMDAKSAMTTVGAQNLTQSKISKVLLQVENYLASNPEYRTASGDGDSEESEESYDEE